MPPKKCRCSICDKEVLKARTYYIGGDKRACKDHPGVMEKSQKLVQKQKEKSLKSGRKLPTYPGSDEPLDWPPKPRCWNCERKGLYQRDFFLRRLVEMEKWRIIEGKFINPFDLSHPSNQPKEPCIFLVSAQEHKRIVGLLIRKYQVCAEISGMIALCPRCLQHYKIEPPLPKISTEQLVQFAGSYEALVKPLIEKMAVLEMGKDQ
jgi:hypothetical protein